MSCIVSSRPEARHHVEAAPDRGEHPSARQSTLSRPSASRSSLSHWMTVRSGIAAFSTGTIRSSASRAMTKPPTCCDRCAERHQSLASAISRTIVGLSGSKPASRMRSGRPRGRPTRRTRRRAVELREVEPQRTADVTHRALRPIGDQRRRQRGAVAAVFRVDVLDDLLAPLVLEIDVDVGRLVALLRDEALEQHVHARRIDLGDAERIAHRRVGRRAAPWQRIPLIARTRRCRGR